MLNGFDLARNPRIVFRPGALAEIGDLAGAFGARALLVTGGSSLAASGRLKEIEGILEERSIEFSHSSLSHEPSPEYVDGAVREFRDSGIEVVLAVGGGSVIDASKAISAMLPRGESVLDFLEDVGTRPYDGTKIPFIAVPTTAGTGSEATKNAVLSRVSRQGFKKSLRHDNLVPDVALVDPELTLSCGPAATAACGLDAFTQLLESYVSPWANPITDALAMSGMEQVVASLVRAYESGSSDIEARTGMAYGALISGITLANAGLGIVHGLASVIGGRFDIPHGVVCGTLLAPATRANTTALSTSPDEAGGLAKYARAGALLSGKEYDRDKNAELCEELVAVLEEWARIMDIPRIGRYGIAEEDLAELAGAVGARGNPFSLSETEIETILRERL